MIITIPVWLLITLGVVSSIVIFILAMLGILFLIFIKGYNPFPA